jgi:hypothetical protein
MNEGKNYLGQIKQLLDRLQQDEFQQKDPTLVGFTPRAPLPLQLKTGSTGGCSGPHDIKPSQTTLKSLPGRGVGVVATRLIPTGSIILQEDATLTVPSLPAHRTLEFLFNLVARYVDCSAEVRHSILSLHAYNRPEDDNDIRSLLAADSGNCRLTEQQVDLILRLNSILTTNNFDDTAPSNCSLYLEASRFNHSCLPNCDYGHTSEEDRATITIRASREIQPDEEICVTYLINHEPRDERRAETKLSWGFECNCPACDVADPTVDTTAHEEMLLEYRRLRKDPLLKAYVTPGPNSMSPNELDEAVFRSTRRAQIALELGDIYGTMMQYVLSIHAFCCLLLLKYTTNVFLIALA